MSRATVATTVKLDVQLHTRLVAISRAHEVPMVRIVEEGLEIILRRYDKKAARIVDARPGLADDK